MLPTFIMIGPGKSGTTWMYKMLSQHPEICVSKTKETLFFENYFEKGIEWYQRFFKHCYTFKVIGEFSNTYFWSPLVAQRIYATFKDNIKLITCLRNPIDRIFSYYLFQKKHGLIDLSFEEALEKYPEMWEKCFSYKYLKTYMDLFPRKNICVLIFDDLCEKPVTFLKNIYEFVGVDKSFVPKGVSKQVLPDLQPRSSMLAKIAKRSAMLIRKLGFPEIVTRLSDDESMISKILYKPFKQKPVMRSETRSRLQKELWDDVHRLSNLIGRDLTKWVKS